MPCSIGCFGNEDQVATATRAGKFPSQGLVAIFIDHFRDDIIGHQREHGDLCFKGSAEAAPKRSDIFATDGIPAAQGRVCQRFGPIPVDLRLAEHIEFRAARPKRDHVDRFLDELQGQLIVDRFDARGPVITIIMGDVQPGKDNADRVLRSGNLCGVPGGLS